MTESTPPTPNARADTAAIEGFDLSPDEIRVLGVLIEKAFVTPDSYPLSVNAITTGSNQLTGRDPVMSLSDTDVQNALDKLTERRLVSQRDQRSARVAKYEHLVRLRYSLPPAEQAALAVLMLRGAQTAGEIRQRTERMHPFPDIASVDATLEHLSDKYPPMVVALPRLPGTKETRFAHLIGGETMLSQQSEALQDTTHSNVASTRGRTAELEEEVRQLRQDIDTLRNELASFRSQFE